MWKKTRWVDVIEAAYSVESDPKAWLSTVAAAARSSIDAGLGVCAATYDVSDPRPFRYTQFASVGCPQLLADGVAGTQWASERSVRRRYLMVQCGSASQNLTRAQMDRVFGSVRALGVFDAFGVNAADPNGFGLVLTALMSKERPFDRARLDVWARIAGHLAAGHRIGRRLAEKRQTVWEGAEAVLDPSGRLQHAEGAAKRPEAQTMLRRAAITVDRARARRRTDPEEAVELWTALVEGRWSLVDHCDSDGRRYYIARKNDPDAPGHRALTEREKQVVAYAGLGHSNKLIAYELGLSTPTIANHLAEAAAKLGLRSRAALIQAYAAFVESGALK